MTFADPNWHLTSTEINWGHLLNMSPQMLSRRSLRILFLEISRSQAECHAHIHTHELTHTHNITKHRFCNQSKVVEMTNVHISVVFKCLTLMDKDVWYFKGLTWYRKQCSGKNFVNVDCWGELLTMIWRKIYLSYAKPTYICWSFNKTWKTKLCFKLEGNLKLGRKERKENP